MFTQYVLCKYSHIFLQPRMHNTCTQSAICTDSQRSTLAHPVIQANLGVGGGHHLCTM